MQNWLSLKQPEFLFWMMFQSVALQQGIRHQQTAFKNFFEGRTKYPTFKRKLINNRQNLPKVPFKFTDGKIYIAKSKEPLNVRWSRQLPNEPKALLPFPKTVQDVALYRACVNFENQILPKSDSNIGIDVGIKHLFVTDSGIKIDNPRLTAKYATKLAIKHNAPWVVKTRLG